MSERRRILYLMGIMAVCCAVVGGVLMALLYRTSVHQQQERLMGVAQSRARMIEAIMDNEEKEFQAIRHEEYPNTTPLDATVEQLRHAHTRFKGFGSTGEFTFAEKNGGEIVFLLSHRHGYKETPDPVAFNSRLAEPMRRALKGQSGTIVGLDYRGEQVLAAYEPVRISGRKSLGIVAKIDLKEVRAPFVRAGFIGGGICLAVVLFGAVAFVRVSRPMLDKMEQYAHDLENEIVERKAQAEALEKSHALLDTVVEGITEPLYIKDLEGRYILANGAMQAVLGRSAESIVGNTARDLFDAEAAQFIQDSDRDLLESGAPLTVEETTPINGKPRVWLTSKTPYMDNRGRIIGIIGLSKDITDRKTAEQNLRDSEAKFRELSESIADIFFALNGKLQFTYWNKTAQKFFGIPTNQAVGRHLNEVFTDATGFGDGQMYKQVLEDQQTAQFFVDSQEKHFDVSVYPSSHGLSIFARDITDKRIMERDREKLQAQLLQSQKMEAVGQLAGGMAHDFNNMLTVIMSNAELALMNLADDAPETGELKEILRASERSRDLTMKLLTFSRKEPLDIRTVRIGRVIDELVAMLDRSLPKKIAIKQILNHDLAVRVDVNQIQQALVNVCNNAADAMPAGGTLTIECTEVQFEEEVCMTCGRELGPRYCQIQISDTGVGIPREILDKIVEPFFTTKGVGKGTGLGLSVTHGIINSHQGHLHFYSEPGEGTCVRIYIPFAEDKEASAMQEEDLSHLMGSEIILVVDDEDRVLSAAQRLLTKAGYSPLAASSGAQAMEIFNERGHEIAAVVLDLIMPEMDGSDVFHELKRRRAAAKIILCSGYSINGQAGELMSLGVDAFLQKPFTAASLCGAIRRALDT